LLSRMAVAGALVVLGAAPAAVHAQAAKPGAYPTRPVRLIVPLAPGGGMDATTRGLAQALTESLNQSVVVDNRPGAGSQVALDIVANAAPDGHTLCMLSATIVIHPLLYPSRFEVLRDFTPISQVTAQGYVLVAHPSLPVKSALDLVKY